MSAENLGGAVEERNPLSALAAVARHDLVRWNGMVAEVVDVAHLGPGHDQVVLQRLDRKALPISMPMSELIGAEVWHYAGKLH